MNTKLLLIAISVAAFSSCTTLYKSGQTPDDVYYSPVRFSGEDKKTEQQEQVHNNVYRNEEIAIRLGINDYRWRYFDNDYRYNPYHYGFNYGYYYNPYFWPYPVYNSIYVKPTPINSTPRMANLTSYNTPIKNSNTTYSKAGNIGTGRTYNNSNKGSAVGNVIRQIFLPGSTETNSSSGLNNNSSNSNRSYTPSSSSSGSSGSRSSSGSGGISRPSRGGN